jgi:SAM-dependent methyltransferase
MATPENLASVEFWEEDYLRNIELPARPDPEFPFERSLMETLGELAPVGAGGRVLEVGCAPGRWLLWYAERFGALVSGVEYSGKGAAFTRENLAMAGVTGDIREADFFASHLDLGFYDVVLSLGFIEHFDSLAEVLARHASLVAPGGKLVVGVPNFRGLIGFLQGWGDPEYLALHNAEAMDPRTYERALEESEMSLDVTRYIGGPDPSMLRIRRRSAHVIVLPLTILRRARLTDRLNSRGLSSYLVMVFSRHA